MALRLVAGPCQEERRGRGGAVAGARRPRRRGWRRRVREATGRRRGGTPLTGRRAGVRRDPGGVGLPSGDRPPRAPRLSTRRANRRGLADATSEADNGEGTPSPPDALGAKARPSGNQGPARVNRAWPYGTMARSVSSWRTLENERKTCRHTTRQYTQAPRTKEDGGEGQEAEGRGPARARGNFGSSPRRGRPPDPDGRRGHGGAPSARTKEPGREWAAGAGRDRPANDGEIRPRPPTSGPAPLPYGNGPRAGSKATKGSSLRRQAKGYRNTAPSWETYQH